MHAMHCQLHWYSWPKLTHLRNPLKEIKWIQSGKNTWNLSDSYLKVHKLHNILLGNNILITNCHLLKQRLSLFIIQCKRRVGWNYKTTANNNPIFMVRRHSAQASLFYLHEIKSFNANNLAFHPFLWALLPFEKNL